DGQRERLVDPESGLGAGDLRLAAEEGERRLHRRGRGGDAGRRHDEGSVGNGRADLQAVDAEPDHGVPAPDVARLRSASRISDSFGNRPSSCFEKRRVLSTETTKMPP